MHMICPSVHILPQQSSHKLCIFRVAKNYRTHLSAPPLCWRRVHMLPAPSILRHCRRATPIIHLSLACCALVILYGYNLQDEIQFLMSAVVVIPVSILTFMLYANLLARTISEINREY